MQCLNKKLSDVFIRIIQDIDRQSLEYLIVAVLAAPIIEQLLFGSNPQFLHILALIMLFLGVKIGLNVSNKFWNEKISLFIMSNLAHLGDALTTYHALKKGLSEQNPVILPIIDLFGDQAIFGVKFLILPITAYVYLRINDRNASVLLKTIFLIGLYLTANNLIAIL